MTPAGGWGRWTVVLCKPDATTRNLVEPILEWIGGHVRIVASRQTVVTAPQILTHYADMLELQHRFPFNVETDLRTHYVGATITVALATGDDDTTARRVRDLLGHYDPAVADPRTIRGHFGRDSADKAATEGRFIHNLVHSSDDADAAQRDFSIWFGTPYLHLLKEEPPR